MDAVQAHACGNAPLPGSPPSKAGREPEDVAADGIGDLHGARRGRQLTHVARVAEVIDQALGVHGRSPMIRTSLMLNVVAALIERGGRLLICRRTATDAHPLKWEFPGG